MQKEPYRLFGIIGFSPDDLKNIINGETTIGFKYDGIGCVISCPVVMIAILLNCVLYVSRYMLLLCAIYSVAALIGFVIAVKIKDYETFYLRRFYAIACLPIIALVWFCSGGISSPTGYIWMIFGVSYNSFLVTGKKGKWYVSYAILVNVIAMALCFFCPQMLLPVENAQHLMVHNIIFAVLVCVYIGMTTWFQRKIAENLQDKFARTNQELQELNKEIQAHMQIQMQMTLKEEKLRLERKQAEETSVLLVQSLSNAIEARDLYLRGHSRRVSEYAVLIARKLGLSEEEIGRIRMAAALHDVGKISVPDSVLNKPSRLTDEEYGIIKNHCKVGYDILKDIGVISYTADVARHHHERYNGTGYPDGLKGEEISLQARIVAVADSFDAMNSMRVYRKPLDREQIRNEIVKGRGGQFDPVIADAFLELYDSGVTDEVQR